MQSLRWSSFPQRLRWGLQARRLYVSVAQQLQLQFPNMDVSGTPETKSGLVYLPGSMPAGREGRVVS